MPSARMRAGLVACAIAALGGLPAPAAQAHDGHGAHASRADRLLARGVLGWRAPARATRRVGGRRVRITSHADRRVARLPRRSPLARSSSVAAGLSPTWCGDATPVDRPNPLNNAPQVKVVYAHPSDVPSRLATYGGLIQSAVRTAAEVVEARAGGSRTLRLDVGSTCGSQYLDIASVELPQTRAQYVASKQVDTDAIRAQLGLPAGEVNMLVWVDDVGVPGDPLGVGETILDDRPGAANANTLGGRDALVIGRGAKHFIRDDDASAWEPAAVALHEVTHTLGAVQNGAPHSSRAGHCTDEWDIMCYADGSPTNPLDKSALTFTCGGPDAAQEYDCGGDDYFNVSPAPGSWLAAHWNVAFSPFLCAAAKCFATLQRPTVTPLPASASPDLYEPVTLTASDVTDDGPPPLVQWDAPGVATASAADGGRSLTLTWDSPGARTVTIYVTDADGNLATAEVPVTVVNRPPAAELTAPAEATSGEEVLLTARDAARRPVARYQWDLDGAPGFERDSGANAHEFATFPAAGPRTVAVRVTDSGGASAEASATIDVRPPAPAASTERTPARIDLRLARRLARAALRGTLLLRVRSTVTGRVQLRAGVRRDGSAPLLRRSVAVRAGTWTAVRLRLPARSKALRTARALRISASAADGGRSQLVVPVR